MKLSLSLTVICCLFLPSIRAQEPVDEYKYFDSHWKTAKEKKAVYLLRIHFTKDSCWQFSYYNMYGPLLRIETYRDQKATLRQGLFAWYDADGKMDSCGYYDQGLRDKNWFFSSAADPHRKDELYRKGRLLNKKECEELLKAESIKDPAFPDFSRDTPESFFPGGPNGWLQYLESNLRYPRRAVSHYMDGTVRLLFTVSPAGILQDIRIMQSVEVSLDDEAIRITETSPAWIPAIKMDRKVRSFKIQPIAFRLQVTDRR